MPPPLSRLLLGRKQLPVADGGVTAAGSILVRIRAMPWNCKKSVAAPPSTPFLTRVAVLNVLRICAGCERTACIKLHYLPCCGSKHQAVEAIYHSCNVCYAKSEASGQKCEFLKPMHTSTSFRTRCTLDAQTAEAALARSPKAGNMLSPDCAAQHSGCTPWRSPKTLHVRDSKRAAVAATSRRKGREKRASLSRELLCGSKCCVALILAASRLQSRLISGVSNSPRQPLARAAQRL